MVTTLEMQNLGKKELKMKASTIEYKREKRISGIEDTLEDIDTIVQENSKD